MVGVAGVAVARKYAQRLDVALAGTLRTLNHEVGGPFAEVQPMTVRVEGTTGLRVQNHQRVEAVEVEGREALRATHNGHVHLSRADEVGAEDDGVGRRGAGCGDGGDEAELAGILFGNQVGTGSAVVHSDVFLMLFVSAEVMVIALALLHAADSIAGDEGDALPVGGIGQVCVLYGFAQGHTA